MYLGYQGNKIKFYTETPLNQTIYNIDRVEETSDEYVLNGDEYVLKTNPAVIAQAKLMKYQENDLKAGEARYGQEFTVTIQEQECVFDTTEQTQRDLLTAFAVCSTGQSYEGWVTNNGVVLDLTMEDVALISQVFKEKSNVYDKWNLYKQAIDEAVTLEDVQAIVIDYEVIYEV